MILTRLCTCGAVWLFLVFFSLNPARAEVSLITTGISSLVENKVSQAEKAAFDDALFKAYIETALKVVPGSSSKDLVLRLRGFVSARGTEDIIQYKIVSRSQIDTMLVLTMDIRINDNPLREWLRSQSLTTPLSMRPKILLVITSRGPGLSERYEWWTTGIPKGYSTFEAQLALRLRDAGENVSDPPPRITVPPAGSDKALSLGASYRADLVITGLLTHRSTDAITLDSRLDISLVDPKTRQNLLTSSVMLRGNLDQRTMNELLITAVLDQFRLEIAKKVSAVTPAYSEKGLCIEGIRDNDSYQALLAALRSMDAVSKITVSRIEGHTICHAIQIKGSLQDIMESLKEKNITPVDMAIDGDTAHLRLLNQ